MNNELLALLAKMGCTVTEENGKIVIEQGKKEEMFVPKDGDIVVADSGPFIFKGFHERFKLPVAYGGIDSMGKFIESGINHWTYNTVRGLVTEEEKALLFAKMKEAGKQWNAEKKCIEDLPYQPKHKEFVWCWDEGMPPFERCGRFYDLKHRCTFNGFGKYCGYAFTRYEPFEGELPKWAKEAVNKLED